MVDVTKKSTLATIPTVTTTMANKPFNMSDYIKDKVKEEPRLVWLSTQDHVAGDAHIYILADNSNWANTASLSTDGLQPLSNNPQAQMDILDVRFQQVKDALLGKGAA
jgi:hypothetical protein